MKQINFDILITILRKMGIGKNNDGDIKSAVDVFKELQEELQEVQNQEDIEESVENHYEELFGTLGEVFGKNIKEIISFI